MIPFGHDFKPVATGLVPRSAKLNTAIIAQAFAHIDVITGRCRLTAQAKKKDE
jgi:hypothetical protein